MSYNSVANFKLHAFPSGSFNGIPDTQIQHALDVAASELNAALRPHHTLPLATGSYGSGSDLELIYAAEINIAAYRLMQFRGLKPNVDGTNDQVLYQRYLEVMDPQNGLLAKLSSGRILLPMDSDATPTYNEKRSRLYGNPGRSIRIIDEESGVEYI